MKKISLTPNATTGTCTANLGERGDFVGDETKMKLYKDAGEGRWYAMATHNVKEDEAHFYDFIFRIPYEGSVTNKVYMIDKDVNNPNTVNATFWEFNGPDASPFIADKGQVTFTIDEKEEKATASFKFDAVSPTHELVTVTEGAFDLAGFDASLTGPKEHKATGSFTAEIQDGEDVKQYSAVEFDLTANPGNDTNFPVEHWRAWSKQPGSPNAVIVLFVANTLETNKEYTLIRDSAEVRAMYIEFDSSGISSYLSIDGKLQLDTVQLNKDSSLDVLAGSIVFEAERSDGSKTVNVKKGLFNFDGTKRPV
ncbi:MULTISPECIES: hypothetical protein [Pseudomonas]|jgi:hypothetical protein|uniref:hypothetical protein n=1 Tax=Pseudomonas TaxID=286 RepID=UPI001C83E512|nr:MULTISPECIES: hypothetical protein [Pseudomonas]MDI1332175.1 hypothetical protein [Pseudomonas sp.]MDO8710020.1 hypothetical protein [Pseudomonas sp.]QZB00790.1 hypothetical protein K3369_14640 [Pseudomonas mandelii]WNF58301.1 hypothetical protein RHP74_13765 [Pseudomonas sp. SG20052]